MVMLPSSRERRPERHARSCRSLCSGRGFRPARSGFVPLSDRGCVASRYFAAIRNPGVQKPHCKAACSRNFACNGCSLSPVAMPSMVSMRWPVASAPSTRHEHTNRPSRMTLHAPQSPVPQPSLAPMSPRWSRSTSSSVSSNWHRYSTSSPLIVVETAMPDITFLLPAHGRSRQRASPSRLRPAA